MTEVEHRSKVLGCRFIAKYRKDSKKFRVFLNFFFYVSIKTQGAVALHNLLQNSEYQKFLIAAPFIDMRHFDHLEGTYEVDELDWKLCELIARIQYATQQHFFGVMAEKYFDDMNNDVQITGKRHYQKSVDGYNRLPEVFDKEDIKRCFGNNGSAYVAMKIKRFSEDRLIERIEDGEHKGKFRKLMKLMA